MSHAIGKYELFYTSKFKRKLKRLVKRNLNLISEVREVLQQLAINPKYPSLNSHKVKTVDGIIAWSSRISGDLRIIWREDGKALLIVLLDIGGHSGSKKVY